MINLLNLFRKPKEYEIEPFGGMGTEMGELGDMGLLPTQGGTSFLLDQLSSTPAIALSSRKLRAAYAGSAMTVRRSSDNTTQNIGFVNNNLDTTSLATFVGANSAFTNVWFDQSGNNVNPTQATIAKQPRIVNAGTNNVVNGHVVPLFINANATLLPFPTSLNIAQPFTISVLFQFGTNKAHLFDGEGGRTIFGVNVGAYGFFAGTAFIGGGAVDTSLHSAILVANGASSFVYVDGVAIASNANPGAGSFGDGTNSENLGGSTANGDFVDANLGEFILTLGAMSAGDRALIRANWQTYWGAP